MTGLLLDRDFYFRSVCHQPLLWWLYWLLTAIAIAVIPPASLAKAPEAPKPSDVRIVVDISGSMKKNDPQNLRRPALDMLAKLLPEESRAGVWTFGQYVNMLIKHRPVDEAWKQELDSQQSAINSIAQFTNIGEALEKAAYDKGYSTKGEFQTHVILLTDGMVDIDRDPAANTRERNRILDEILPQYKEAGYTIHTISLSDKADKKLMDRLALATHGQSAVAKTADELMKVFLQVFDQAVPKEEVPLEGNSFATDSSIEEFTALIFRQPNSPETRLISPDDSEYTQATDDPMVNWYRTDKYDLITVKQPLEGEWRVVAELEPQSRVTVVSDLSLVVKSIPVNLLLGKPVDLSLVLREENQVVKRAEFLELLDIDVSVEYLDGGDDWSQRLSAGLVPGNGVYETTLDYFNKVGDYRIAVMVDGKSFKRRFSHRASVRPPFAIDSETLQQKGQTVFKVTVTPQTASIDLDTTQVVGKLKDPSGSSNIKKFQLNDEQTWELLIEPKEEGSYHLALRITTENDWGEPSNTIPKPITFKYPPTDDLFETLTEEEEPLMAPELDQPEAPTLEAEDKVDEELEETIVGDEDELAEEGEDALEEEEAEEDGWMQWALYGMLAVVNILIILVVYILYRKLFAGRSNKDEDQEESAEETTEEGEPDDAPPLFNEPPMDEMVVDDLSDEDVDAVDDSAELPNETVAEEDVSPETGDEVLDVPAEEEDPLAELTPEALDDDEDGDKPEAEAPADEAPAEDDEDPEFSLDDFAPDALDDDEDTPKE